MTSPLLIEYLIIDVAFYVFDCIYVFNITRVARATEYSQRSTGNYPARATEFADCAEAKTQIVKRTSGSFSVGSNWGIW